MAVIRGQSYLFEFNAWDMTTNPPSRKTGDAANITVRISKDGGPLSVTTNNPVEVSATYAPGLYRVTLTASEMDGNTISVIPKSSTNGVECETGTLYTERGVLQQHTSYLTTIIEQTANIGQQVWSYTNRSLSEVSNIVSGVWNAAVRTITGLTTAAIDNIWHRDRATSNPPSGSYGYNLDVQISSRHPNANVTVGGYASGQNPANYILVTPANKLATDTSGRVTVGSNSDKTGYTLTSAEHTQIQSDVQAGMTAQGYTPPRAPKLDNLDAAVTSRAAPGDAMSLTTTERSNIASAVWNFVAELSVSALGLLRLIAAVVQGRRTVSGNTETYYGLDGTTARVVGSVDEQGNRSITTRNP